MEIQKIPVSKLNPAAYNPRKDLKPGDPEYEKLKRSGTDARETSSAATSGLKCLWRSAMMKRTALCST